MKIFSSRKKQFDTVFLDSIYGRKSQNLIKQIYLLILYKRIVYKNKKLLFILPMNIK